VRLLHKRDHPDLDDPHDHGSRSHPHYGDPRDPGGFGWRRAGLAALVLACAAATASLVQVRAGEGTVVTRFGNPVRVLLEPGLAWRLPAPFESTIPVDLRLRTTSSGLQDVGTRDGLRVIVEAYVAWQVPADAVHVQRFLRAVQNQPDEAARQIRTFVGSALEITASGYDLSMLVNTDPDKVRIADFEARLAARSSPSSWRPMGCAWCRWASSG
jgi:membrane protease subunit HflC